MSEEVETTIGVHESGIKLIEGEHIGNTFHCANCNKNIHCHVKVEKKKAEIIMTCNNDLCSCKCRTHYACKICGYLHWYGIMCNREDKKTTPSKESDDAFDQIIGNWRDNHKVRVEENK